MDYNQIIDIQSFCKQIHTQDTVFHYTKVSTAINYILKDNCLKFSKRSEANDPVESAIQDCYVYSEYFGSEKDDELIYKNNRKDAHLLAKKNNDKIKEYKQLSFCRNFKADFDFLNYIGDNFLNYEEKYGFTKPRMWEQYGDQYRGVCLAFSKSKIKELNSDPNLLCGNVKYLKYKKLRSKDLSVNLNTHDNIGTKEYHRLLKNRLTQYLFWKHKDYKGESEYKLCANQKFPSYPYLDIHGCLQAIIVSEKTTWENKECLLEYANQLNIPIIEIEWKHNSIEINEFRQVYKQINEFILRNS